MAQQMVVEMQGLYPFGQVHSVHSDVKILVRKIVPYTKYNYTRLKDKFEIAKSIEHINLIRLLRVLQEEGRFHLIYEYVPHPVLRAPLPIEALERIKMKLIYLCVYLVECGIITFLKLDNLGVDENNEIRYYLDIDFQVAYLDEHKTHIHYIDQIDRIVEELYAESNLTDPSWDALSKRKAPVTLKETQKEQNPARSNRSNALERRSSKQNSLSSASSGLALSHEKQKEKPPLTSRSKPVSSTLQLLNSIERKLDQLKQNIKRHSPKHADREQPPAVPPPPQQPPKKVLTKTQFIQREKPVDKRKYSGDVRSMQSLLMKNIAADSVRSVRSGKKDRHLEKIKESNGEDDDIRREPSYSLVNHPYMRKKSRDASRQLNLQKVLEKERYNKRFLLEDDQESQNTKHPRAKIKEHPKQQSHKEPSLLLSTATELVLPTEKNQTILEQEKVRVKTTQESESKKELNLKERISKALKKSDQAIGRYRKQSIHTISTQFGKRNN